jgi:hypothetical protein
MGEKFRPLEKGVKKLATMEIKFFRRRAGYILYNHKSNEEILEELKVEPDEETLTRYQSNWLRLVTRKNTTGCQNNAELYTKWTKTIWKTFEETIRRGRNRSLKA